MDYNEFSNRELVIAQNKRDIIPDLEIMDEQNARQTRIRALRSHDREGTFRFFDLPVEPRLRIYEQLREAKHIPYNFTITIFLAASPSSASEPFAPLYPKVALNDNTSMAFMLLGVAGSFKLTWPKALFNAKRVRMVICLNSPYKDPTSPLIFKHTMWNVNALVYDLYNHSLEGNTWQKIDIILKTERGQYEPALAIALSPLQLFAAKKTVRWHHGEASGVEEPTPGNSAQPLQAPASPSAELTAAVAILNGGAPDVMDPDCIFHMYKKVRALNEKCETLQSTAQIICSDWLVSQNYNFLKDRVNLRPIDDKLINLGWDRRLRRSLFRLVERLETMEEALLEIERACRAEREAEQALRNVRVEYRAHWGYDPPDESDAEESDAGESDAEESGGGEFDDGESDAKEAAAGHSDRDGDRS